MFCSYIAPQLHTFLLSNLAAFIAQSIVLLFCFAQSIIHTTAQLYCVHFFLYTAHVCLILHIFGFVYYILHTMCKNVCFIAYISFVYCTLLHFIVSVWAQVSFLHGLCKDSLSTVCPAWPDSQAGQGSGWERDPDQTDEEDDPGPILDLPLSLTTCLGNYLPWVVSSVARERQQL